MQLEFSEFTPNYTIENGMFIGVKICSVINLSNQNAQKEFLFNWTYLLLFNTCCFTIEPLLGVLFYLLFFVISTYSIRHVSSRSFWLRKNLFGKIAKRQQTKDYFRSKHKLMLKFSLYLKYNRLTVSMSCSKTQNPRFDLFMFRNFLYDIITISFYRFQCQYHFELRIVSLQNIDVCPSLSNETL